MGLWVLDSPVHHGRAGGAEWLISRCPGRRRGERQREGDRWRRGEEQEKGKDGEREGEGRERGERRGSIYELKLTRLEKASCLLPVYGGSSRDVVFKEAWPD